MKSCLPFVGKWGDRWTKGRHRCHWRHGPGRSQAPVGMVTYLLDLPLFFPLRQNILPLWQSYSMGSLVKFEPPLLYQLIWSCCLSISGGQSGHIVLLWYYRIRWKLLFDVGLSKSVNECVHFLRCVLLICFVCICSLIWDRYLSFCHRNNYILSTDVSDVHSSLCTSCNGLQTLAELLDILSKPFLIDCKLFGYKLL